MDARDPATRWHRRRQRRSARRVRLVLILAAIARATGAEARRSTRLVTAWFYVRVTGASEERAITEPPEGETKVQRVREET